MSSKDLVIKQLDSQLQKWLTLQQRPRHGWVRTIRKALGMTGEQLAKRLGVSRSRVVKIEEAEQKDAVTLHTLREVARAMNCELFYALVPKKSLQAILNQQVEKIVKQHMQRVLHSMQLENQTTLIKFQEELANQFKEKLRRGALKHLWEDEE